MLSPEDIRRRAAFRYQDFLRSIVSGEVFFPLPIRFGKPSASEDFEKLRREINALTNANLGCRIEWVEVNSRLWGRQRLPERVEFTEEASYLEALGKAKETSRFRDNLSLTRARCPALIPFLAARPLDVIEFSDSWSGLLDVCCYLQRNPRPNLYCRELPLPVDTKFAENHQAVLTRLLTIALPPEAVIDSNRFEKRFGLRFDEPQIRLRLLDDSLRVPLEIPFCDVALPLSQFEILGWRELRVIVSENKMTFLTLPSVPQTVGIWGMGNAAAVLHTARWLADCEMFYWGDLDAQGFEILARLREFFPKMQSLMMDLTTLDRFRDLGASGIRSKATLKQRLTRDEEQAYEVVCAANLRLEQERIPNQFATAIVTAAVRGVAP